MTIDNLQARVSEFIARLRFGDLPPAIVHDAKYRLLDWLGSALAGTTYTPAAIVAKIVRESGGAPQASVLRAQAKVPMAQAALANGIFGHVAEYDDGHRLAIAHPGSVTVPTALALTEFRGGSGQELLAAIVCGYEVLIRLATSVNPSHYKIWHTTGTCGTFAAAATAANLLELDAARTRMCLGIAGTMASGLQETFGTHAKPLNVGHACQSGILAALLARDGFTGPDDILLGPKGFVAATCQQFDGTLLDQIQDGKFLSNSAFYKVYASCGHTNAALDALFHVLRKNTLDPSSIKAVRVATYGIAERLTGELKTRTEDEAKFSLPYCMAVALLFDRVTLAEFAPARLSDPEVLALARKVLVVEDPEATARFPGERRTTVTLELLNGSVLEEKIPFPVDTPDYGALDAKFLSLAEMVLDRHRARSVKDIVLDLERQHDLSRLMEAVNS